MATWTPPRGLLAKAVAWIILVALAACVLAVIGVAIVRARR